MKVAGFAIACATAMFASANLLAVEFYLKPGTVEGVGTKESPFGSFAAAQRAVRKAVADPSTPSGAVTVTVLDGSYFIGKALRFGKDDSGSAKHPVVWRAQTRGGARLTGGVPLPALKPLSEDDPNVARIPIKSRKLVQVADLKAAGIGNYGVVKACGFGGPFFMELVWGGKFQTLARWPNEGWTGIAKTEEQKKDEEGRRVPTPSFTYSDDHVSRWADEPAPYGNGFFYYNWAADRVAFDKIDPATKTIWQKGRGSVYGYSKNGFWFGFNLLCELDAPGEYWIDRERGRLYFMPPEGEGGGELTASDELVVFADAAHISFEGFRMENCRQRAAAVVRCEDVNISACAIRNAGDVAVSILKSRDCRMAGCDISYCGAGGIFVLGGNPDALEHGNLTVENCRIHHYALNSLTYTPAVKVDGCGNAVRNCTIHDGPHGAIIFTGREHEFLRNEIYSVCLFSGEMGAIYTGRDWTYCGNRIEANYIHDIRSLRNQPNRAIMLDDGCAGITIVSNRFVNVTEGVSLSGIGNVVENNLFVSNFPPVSTWQMWLDSADFHNTRWTHKQLLDRLAMIPVHEEPWKSKYPYLGMIDDAVKTVRLRHPDTRSILRRNISSGGTTNFVSYTRDLYKPRPETWIVEGNTTDGSVPDGFAPLPPLSEIGVYTSP